MKTKVKMFDGQDVVDHYVNALEVSKNITEAELYTWVKYGSTVTYVQFMGDKFQFRIETRIKKGVSICQYVTVDIEGVMTFRSKLPWFVPGDFLFQTFGEALRFVNNKQFAPMGRRSNDE